MRQRETEARRPDHALPAPSGTEPEIRALALDLMRDSVFILDESGRFVDANEAAYRTRGYAREELLEMDVRALDTPEFAGHVGHRLAEIASSSGTIFESAHRCKDGSVMPVEVSSRVVAAGGRRLFVSTVRDISWRRQTEDVLRRSAEELRSGMEALEERNRQISCLATMGRELQGCSSESEVWQRAGRFVEQLFPGSGGQLLAARTSAKLLELAAAWGPPRDVCPKTLHGCPAVQGASRAANGPPVSFACREEGVGAGRFCICVPIETRSEPLGVLRIWEPDGHGLSVEEAVASHYGDLAVAAAEQISPVLTNLSLREAFRDLAMRDSLTGLYNRRFLEEAVGRELSRAERQRESLGILMLDLDHFKEFNDAYGHDAGDDILRKLGAFLTRRIRATDVACRYGGEEFTLLLPGMSLEDTIARAEAIRGEVTKVVRVPGEGRPITASIGVAVYPLHGFSSDELLRAADVALYRAKAKGRDRVEVFGRA